MARKRSRRSIETTAYHEAGHAVASFYLQKNFRYATIIPGDGYGGMVKSYSPRFIKYFEGWSFERQRTFAERQIISSIAGYTAQRKFCPQSIRRYQASSDEEHQNNCFNYICSFNVREGDAYWKWLEIRTENLIEFHWKDVKAVAEALLERETLTYEEVYEIIRGHTMPEFPLIKNSWVEKIIKMIESGEISPQEAIDAAEAQSIKADNKDEEKWLLRCKRWNVNELKKELKKKGFTCKEVWQDTRLA
jgi:hypothetical protein